MVDYLFNIVLTMEIVDNVFVVDKKRLPILQMQSISRGHKYSFPQND